VTADQPPPTCAARAPGWVQLAGDAVFGVLRDRGGAARLEKWLKAQWLNG